MGNAGYERLPTNRLFKFFQAPIRLFLYLLALSAVSIGVRRCWVQEVTYSSVQDFYQFRICRSVSRISLFVVLIRENSIAIDGDSRLWEEMGVREAWYHPSAAVVVCLPAIFSFSSTRDADRRTSEIILEKG